MRLAALLLLAACANAQTWKAGVARTVITPKESIWLAGYAARTTTRVLALWIVFGCLSGWGRSYFRTVSVSVRIAVR